MAGIRLLRSTVQRPDMSGKKRMIKISHRTPPPDERFRRRVPKHRHTAAVMCLFFVCSETLATGWKTIKDTPCKQQHWHTFDM
ncbi:hypothetical protein F2P79_003611 [Pimephales promelas]|nr:hypothetical protein F2P79_003611 [Pimephales promelas]